MTFLDLLGLTRVDVLWFSLGGMVAQVMALKRPALLRRIILTGTGPEGGVGVAMDRPELLEVFVDQKMAMSEKLVKLFFATTETSQSAGRRFVQQLAWRTEDKDTPTTAEAAGAQLAAMGAWAKSGGEPYADLKKITQPVLVTNGNNDTMIPTSIRSLSASIFPMRSSSSTPTLVTEHCFSTLAHSPVMCPSSSIAK
ncbi:MAG: putative hydrolase [Bryobacterales bacterium]|nr:putative hydrolase [Bryobacterales bacterium]